ncbi:hypothetical protein AAC387_Pa02g4706 [Persea americana]
MFCSIALPASCGPRRGKGKASEAKDRSRGSIGFGRERKELWSCSQGCGACCKLDKGPPFATPEEILDDPDHVKVGRVTGTLKRTGNLQGAAFLQITSLQIEGDSLVLVSSLQQAINKSAMGCNVDLEANNGHFTFHTRLDNPLLQEEQYWSEQSCATKFTRMFYHLNEPFSESSRTAILISDDSDSSAGHPQSGRRLPIQM